MNLSELTNSAAALAKQLAEAFGTAVLNDKIMGSRVHFPRDFIVNFFLAAVLASLFSLLLSTYAVTLARDSESANLDVAFDIFFLDICLSPLAVTVK